MCFLGQLITVYNNEFEEVITNFVTAHVLKADAMEVNGEPPRKHERVCWIVNVHSIFNDPEGLKFSISNFWHIENLIEKAFILFFEMNTTEVSCNRVDSTFAPFYQNAIKKLELFCND